jgi:DNA-directed RNA polymerase specialized sigma24 family protein
MDDEAILAGLDGEPDAFAVFYRRHVAVLLEHVASRTHDRGLAADLCAEAFATALEEADRFDPARGLAVDWLYGIARRLLNEAGRRGAVEGRARRRLGLAALEPGDGFVGALEEELVEAARFRAWRRRSRLALPLVGLRALAVIAALALVAAVGALAVGRGGSDPRAPDGSARQRASFVVPLAPMLSTAACHGLDVRGESAAQAAAAIGVADGVLRAGVRVVSPLGVSDDAGCVAGEGPGACLVVEDRSSYRCFGLADVRAGRALARTAEGLIVGVVPDDVDRVTLTARGRTARAVVVDNVYEARLGVPSGTRVRVALDLLWDDVCRRGVAPGLLARVATLRREPDDRVPVPQAVRRALDGGSEDRFDGVLLRGARRWGSDGGVEFWAVPVVARGSGWCAPANGVCVVAVAPDRSADAACMPRRRQNPEFWRVAPLLPGNAAIFGVVADDVIGARVTVGTLTAQVDARGSLIGGVLPFPYQDGVRVDLIRRTAP